jgi:hypothetical protein
MMMMMVMMMMTLWVGVGMMIPLVMMMVVMALRAVHISSPIRGRRGDGDGGACEGDGRGMRHLDNCDAGGAGDDPDEVKANPETACGSRQTTDNDLGFIPGTTTTTATNTSTNPTPSTTHLRRPTVEDFILGRGLDGDAIGYDTEPILHQLFVATFRPAALRELLAIPASVPARFKARNSASWTKDRASSGSSGLTRESSTGVTPRDSDPPREQAGKFYVMTNLPPPS